MEKKQCTLQIKKVSSVVYVDEISSGHVKRLFKCTNYYSYDNEIHFYVKNFRIAILYIDNYLKVAFK